LIAESIFIKNKKPSLNNNTYSVELYTVKWIESHWVMSLSVRLSLLLVFDICFFILKSLGYL
jgi:hypothetical protein